MLSFFRPKIVVLGQKSGFEKIFLSVYIYKQNENPTEIERDSQR